MNFDSFFNKKEKGGGDAHSIDNLYGWKKQKPRPTQPHCKASNL